ncbi:MAG TPA: protein kinase [Anaerolineales bacterium]|nr:protein kinase [Anaerolineales bacterium]
MLPEKIGRYEIKAELGRGGMATVYHAYDPRFEREVAIKVLPPELLHADPQFRLRFEREAKIIASLEHSSIVPVYDVGDENGQPYFVMRYMTGGSLAERIKAGIMTVEEATRILERIAPGLDEAHRKGIIHRDLKPSNILFDGWGTPYISDFGIAKLSQAQASSMTGSAIIGTPAYMAPEQASGEAVDGRADIYALGVILFEMLTGKQPYEADTPMAVALKHITDPVPRILEANPNLPPDIEYVIQTAMAKNRDERFSTAGELVEALHAVIAGRTQALTKRTMAPTVKASIKEIPAARKSLNAWFFIIPLLLIGMIGGGFVLFNAIGPSVPTEAPITATTSVLPTETIPIVPSTEAPIVPIEPPTNTPPPPTPTDTPAPSLPVIGGADKIAFVANNEIWLMNVDGSDLRQLTTDGASKSDLQWLPDGETILFISGKTVKYYNVTTDTVDTLTSFPSEVTLDAFQVSHDGTKVMIAMSNNIFVVPFDFETMRTITNRNQLIRMEDHCIVPTDGTRAALRVRETRWSADDQLVAWLFKGNDAVNPSLQADQISVFNITACKPEQIDLLDNFPGTRFTPVGFQNRIIPDFDWDGFNQFFFNTSRRNEGWGELYLYNWQNHKPTQLYPVEGKCCYRDARWSPDGTYIFVAFQDITLGAAAPTVLYYIPVGELNTGAIFTPLPIPEDFFRNPREATQPALRPATTP